MAERAFPPAVLKAMVDPFDYAAFVSGLGLVFFDSAEDLGGGWVRLYLNDLHEDEVPNRFAVPFARGLEVHATGILWAADAPFGS